MRYTTPFDSLTLRGSLQVFNPPFKLRLSPQALPLLSHHYHLYQTRKGHVPHHITDASNLPHVKSNMTGKLEGKVALVTGASSGMGKLTAIAFARERAKV